MIAVIVQVMIGLVLLTQGVVLLINLAHRRRRMASFEGASIPCMAVLVPVRNERHNLPRLLDALKAQSVVPNAILIYDDESTDGSPEWLKQHARAYGVRLVPTVAKPDGWTGKAWACYQLGNAALDTGVERLLFLDADVEPERDCLRWLGQAMGQFPDATLFTVIPRLVPAGIGDALLHQVMMTSLFTLLPLPLAEAHPNPAFAFANGQCLAYRATAYAQDQPHQAVAASVLDDVGIAQLIKQRRQSSSQTAQIIILHGVRYLRTYMYRRFSEAVEGYSKNAVALCRGVVPALAIGLAMMMVYWLPLVWGSPVWRVGCIGVSVLLFGVSGWCVGLPFGYGLLYPLSIALALGVLTRSLFWNLRGAIRWKGRLYPR
jgi:chlorobactene glucosyltransferase